MTLDRNTIEEIGYKSSFENVNIDTSYLQNQFKTACIFLKLPLIKLSFINFLGTSSYYNELKNEIVINLNPKEALEGINQLKYSNIFISDSQYFILFCLYHELGHHLQQTKFTKWWLNFVPTARNFIYKIDYYNTKSIHMLYREYRQLKVEHNADKIAIICMKKFHSNYWRSL